MIVADDLSSNDVGHRNPDVRTSDMDALANQGSQLERFYVNVICSPAPSSARDLLPDERTMAEYFAMPDSRVSRPKSGAPGKVSVFEGGNRVPAMLRWQGRIEAGRTIAQPIFVGYSTRGRRAAAQSRCVCTTRRSRSRSNQSESWLPTLPSDIEHRAVGTARHSAVA